MGLFSSKLRDAHAHSFKYIVRIWIFVPVMNLFIWKEFFLLYFLIRASVIKKVKIPNLWPMNKNFFKKSLLS